MSDIDLDALQLPDALETLEFEDIKKGWIDGLEDPDLIANAVPGDLVTEAAQIGAFREMYARAEINDQIKAAFLALSWGNGLDVIGDQMDVSRGSLSEEEYREAIHASPRAIGTGARSRYEIETEKAHPDVLRAHAIRFAPSIARIYFSFPAGGNPTAASTAIVNRVDQGVDDDGFEIRMITDLILILQGTPVAYDITANLHIEPGPDAAEVIALAQERLQPVIESLTIPGYPLSRSEIISALHTIGVAKVDLTQPAADIPAVESEFYRLGTLTITSEVASWLR